MNKVAPIEPEQAAQVPALVRQSKPPVAAGGVIAAIIPKDIDEVFRLARAVCLSGMVPDSYKGGTDEQTASRVMIGIAKGLEVGLPPITALSNIYIVNNRPSIWGDAALALVQHHAEYAGCLEKIDGKPETDGFTATCEIKRKTLSGELVTTTRTFSWADAKRAALVNKGPWRQYPQRMLQMRARAWCIRDSFADALSGLQIREEIEDMPTKPEQVDTAFLDAGETAAIPQVSTAAEMQAEPEPDFDPQAMLDSIKKAFLAAGDDKEQNRQAIEAADVVELPEPQATELRELVATKKARFAIR